MARTEKEKKSSGVLQKSKNQKETRAWKNKWISKVKMRFLFNFSNWASPKKNRASPIKLCLTQYANRVGPKLTRFFRANKNRVQPDPNLGLVGLAQWAGLNLPALVESQWRDAKIVSIRDQVQSGTGDEGWTIHTDGSLRYRGRVVVPQLTDLREEILREFHCSRFVVHPGGTKMYQDLRRQYYWSRMKRYVGDFVRRCLTCQQVKAEHQKPARLLHPLEVAEWKWEHVTMDFVTHFPQTPQRHDAVWVIVERLTKSAHFLAVRMTFSLERFCRLYIREIVRLNGVPVSIVSDREPRFTAHFWKSFQKAIGTRLTMSTTFHPQTDGQSKRTIQVLEDMLRACVLDHHGSWEEHLPLVEFAYNNSYQASI